jgi:hypothetical protein
VRGDRPGDRAADHSGRAAQVAHRRGHDRVLPANPSGVRRSSAAQRQRQSAQGATPALAGGKGLPHQRVGEGHADVIGPRRTGQSARPGGVSGFAPGRSRDRAEGNAWCRVRIALHVESPALVDCLQGRRWVRQTRTGSGDRSPTRRRLIPGPWHPGTARSGCRGDTRHMTAQRRQS